MKQLHFYKYQGTGNDFVMIDNRLAHFFKDDVELIRFLCDRKFGIGGDGLILLENDSTADFKMVYYNADGNESTMCGNGGRCIVAFAKDLGIIQEKTTFNAVDGLHNAHFTTDGNVALQMIDVPKKSILLKNEALFLFTGSPHHIEMVNDLQQFDVYNKGKEVRYCETYKPGGTNVNFVEQISEDAFKIRTYERGVENETLACGTGATAAAIAMHSLGKTTFNLIKIGVEGGDLEVHFNYNDDAYTDVMLIGPAKKVFNGEIYI